jgi:hypothetical protein
VTLPLEGPSTIGETAQRGSVTPAPAPIILTKIEPYLDESADRPLSYSIGANIYFTNESSESYSVKNYFQVTLRPVLSDQAPEFLWLFGAMRERNDTRVSLDKTPNSAGVIGPLETSNFASVYYVGEKGGTFYMGGRLLLDFLRGKVALYFVGLLKAVRGDAVVKVPYCGFIIHQPGGLVNYNGPPVGCGQND